MNAQRRKALSAIASRLEALQDELDAIATDEREAVENMPEGLRESERGQAAEESADALENACEGLGDVLATVQDLEGA